MLARIDSDPAPNARMRSVSTRPCSASSGTELTSSSGAHVLRSRVSTSTDSRAAPSPVTASSENGAPSTLKPPWLVSTRPLVTASAPSISATSPSKFSRPRLRASSARSGSEIRREGSSAVIRPANSSSSEPATINRSRSKDTAASVLARSERRRRPSAAVRAPATVSRSTAVPLGRLRSCALISKRRPSPPRSATAPGNSAVQSRTGRSAAAVARVMPFPERIRSRKFCSVDGLSRALPRIC